MVPPHIDNLAVGANHRSRLRHGVSEHASARERRWVGVCVDVDRDHQLSERRKWLGPDCEGQESSIGIRVQGECSRTGVKGRADFFHRTVLLFPVRLGCLDSSPRWLTPFALSHSVYHIFYRNLFARLRSPDQAIFIQLLSSSFVIFWYPLSMSKTFHRLQTWAFGFDKEWEEYAEGVGTSELGDTPETSEEANCSLCTVLYLRNLSENVTSEFNNRNILSTLANTILIKWWRSLAG